MNDTPGFGTGCIAVIADVTAETIVIDAEMLTSPNTAPVIEMAHVTLDATAICAEISISPALVIAMAHVTLEVLVMLAAQST